MTKLLLLEAFFGDQPNFNMLLAITGTDGRYFFR